jgi:hypothetical protein
LCLGLDQQAARDSQENNGKDKKFDFHYLKAFLQKDPEILIQMGVVMRSDA